MTVHESWKNVGQNIRKLRKAQGLTMKQLATGCDLSPNAISLVERGAVAPTVITLCKIASALGVSASSFLQELCPNEVILVRAESEMRDDPAGHLKNLFGGVPSPDTHFKTLPCQAPYELCDLQSRYSQQMVMCLCSKIEYEDGEGQTYILNTGDRLSCNGNALHRLRNAGNETAIAILVMPRKGNLPEREEKV